MKKFNWNNKTILLTGGTGSFGTAFINYFMSKKQFKGTIRVFSRNESKQYVLQQKYQNNLRLRFLIGDIRDLDRVLMAMHGVDVVIHAAALKHISSIEYNPFEAINTNIVGSQHVIRAAMEAGVERVMFLSSSLACHPTNLSGSTKLTAEMLFVQSNLYAIRNAKFSVARFSDALDNQDGIISLIQRQKIFHSVRVPHEAMTRFWSTTKDGVEFVIKSMEMMKGGEIFVPKLQAVNMVDLAKAIAPGDKILVGKSLPEDSLSETLITKEEISKTLEYDNHFMILPDFSSQPETKRQKLIDQMPDGYNSATCDSKMNLTALRTYFR